MVRHKYLIDPVKRTKDMNESEFTKYTGIANAQTEPTEPNIVEEIRKQFYDQHLTDANRAKLDKIWGFISQKIKTNAGLAAFILDYEGAKSRFFFPWLVNVFRSPSTALEMAYGAGTDVDGNWIHSVPTSDQIEFFIRNDPTFVYNRERQLLVADLATTFQDLSYNCYDHKSKVVDLGAGRLAWARWHNFDFDPGRQTILAFDKDPTINYEELFGSKEAMEMMGLKFKHGDLMAQINNPECMGSDLIILGGVASYIRSDVFTQAVVMPAYHLLNPNGIFFFDLQVDCPYLRRSMSIFDWPKMYLADSAEAAIASMEKIRKALWAEGHKMSAEYTVDTYNASPSAVMVALQKL